MWNLVLFPDLFRLGKAAPSECGCACRCTCDCHVTTSSTTQERSSGGLWGTVRGNNNLDGIVEDELIR